MGLELAAVKERLWELDYRHFHYDVITSLLICFLTRCRRISLEMALPTVGRARVFHISPDLPVS